jgi:hypothetical protein
VRAFDPHHAVLKKIDALNSDGSPTVSTRRHPYTSFLREDQFPTTMRAVDLICSNPPNESWRNICSRTRILRVNAQTFADKIVIIGIAGVGGDIHQSVLGKVPGVILQANYIESLEGVNSSGHPRWGGYTNQKLVLSERTEEMPSSA